MSLLINSNYHGGDLIGCHICKETREGLLICNSQSNSLLGFAVRVSQQFKDDYLYASVNYQGVISFHLLSSPTSSYFKPQAHPFDLDEDDILSDYSPATILLCSLY